MKSSARTICVCVCAKNHFNVRFNFPRHSIMDLTMTAKIRGFWSNACVCVCAFRGYYLDMYHMGLLVKWHWAAIDEQPSITHIKQLKKMKSTYMQCVAQRGKMKTYKVADVDGVPIEYCITFDWHLKHTIRKVK